MRITYPQLLLMLVALLMVLIAQARCETKVHTLAAAVARTEGFGVNRALPTRLHNPGDIRSRLTHAYAGQVGLYHGYVVFKTDYWGWAALERQIQRVIDGTSTKYDQSMTFAAIAKIYAASPQWSKNLCYLLKITPQTTFEEYFSLAPRVRMVFNDVTVRAFERTSMSNVP